MRRFLSVLALLGSVAPVLAQAPAPATQNAAPQTYESKVVNGKGEPIGTATIRDGASALVLRLAIQPGGLPPGWHGIHFHAVADCSDMEKIREVEGPCEPRPEQARPAQSGRTG